MNSFDLFGNPAKVPPVTKRDRGETLNYSEDVEGLGDEIHHTAPAPRKFTALAVVLVITSILLGAQAYRLQVSNATLNRDLAEGNSVRLLGVPADRGLIVDANGEILAQNTRSLVLAINPQTLPAKRSEREFVYEILKAKAGISEEDIASIEVYRDKTPEAFVIKASLSKDESLLYREWFAEVPGVVLIELPIRKYADIPSLGHLLGYVGRPDQAALDSGAAPNDRIGRAGLEKQYNSFLTGQPGIQHAEVNAAGDIVRLVPDSANSEPRPGHTLKLSIDAKLQRVMAEALKKELERRTEKFGSLPKLGASAVALDPTTGAIKAMVSLPDYGASLFAEGISNDAYQNLLKDPGNPLLNRSTQGTYAPGSTLKPLVAAAGLQEGVISAETQMNTPAAISIGGINFPDWKLHGQTNTRKAIAESNNIFFYAVGGGWAERNFKGLGIDRLADYLGKFGLGQRTGLDLPSEATGVVPNPTWKEEQFDEKWYIGDTYNSSIGQGYVLASPMQMALATAAIANGGTLWEPRLAWSAINPTTGEETHFANQVRRQEFVSSVNLRVVREGMRQTVLTGSSRPLNNLKVTSAGKTGTAQVGTQGQLNAWYTGFAPYENPTLAFAIVIEGGGESYYSSVPVAEEILRGAFNEPLAEGQKPFSSTDVPNDFIGER